jgi:hypothetical protein
LYVSEAATPCLAGKTFLTDFFVQPLSQTLDFFEIFGYLSSLSFGPYSAAF